MPTPVRRRLRHARRFVGYGALVVLIVAALLVGLAKQMLPLVEQHPDKIAAWLSERAGRPVHFARVETQWTRRGPLLRLDDLRIGDASQSILIGDTEMLVSLYAGLLPGRTFTELRLRGLDLTVQRASDGQWSVRGLPGQQQPGADPFAALERLGEVQIIGGRLRVDAPSLGIDATVPRIDLRLRVEGDRVRSGMRAWMQANGAPLSATLDFDRKRGNGRGYAGAKDAELAAWAPLLHVMGVQVQSGHGRAQAWLELRDHRVASMTFDTALDAVVLRGAPLRDASGVRTPQTQFGHVEMRARLRQEPQGWRFDAPRLRIESEGSKQTLDGLLLAGGERYALRAEHVDAGPLLATAALSDRMDAGLRRWILLARPAAVLERVELAGRRNGAMRADGTVSGVGFSPVGNGPGLHRLAGTVMADADGFVFTPDASVKMDFDWPAGFAVVHPMTLRGAIAGWREGAGWRVGFDALKITGTDFGVFARGGMWFQGDGTRPWIDVAADLDTSPVPAAKGFLVRHLMADATEHWLDAALVGGHVVNGHAVVSGDLDNWPFIHNDGLFRADADLQGAVLQFSPEWPAIEKLDGHASFIGNGFTVDGHGTMAGVAVSKVHAALPDYSHAELTVQAEGASDASKLVDLLRHSPLRKDNGETLANVEASGPAAVTFDMLLPLHAGAAKGHTSGTVQLQGARLREKRWNLAFDDVSGKADYGDGGFAANGLVVRHEGQPGKLSLRAGASYVQDAKQAFEAELEASMGAKTLIDRAGNLGWLRPYLDGRSTWTVAVALPKGVAGANAVAAPSKLTLRSNLVGTSLDLPAPLRKPASAALPSTIEADLPMGEGEVRVSLGNLAALRARSRGNQTGLRVVLGSARVDDAPPPSGLVASGRASTLDVVDWIALATTSGGDSKGGGGLPLRNIDVRADRLALIGGVFPDARVQVTPGKGGSNVVVTGPALAGTAIVPDAKGGAITGRFDRAYWRAPPTPANAPATPATDPNPFNPADIPSLSFDIDDLRLNNLALGRGVVRTRQTPTGMRFERFQTDSRQHRITLQGEWDGMGTGAHTRTALSIDSEDFGALLDGLGFGGQLKDGKGSAQFDAMWPGAPRDVGTKGVEGLLALDIKEGALLEVEPGAGRVLGLLSLAQLPRRMLLDFSDVTHKGLAFNRVDGHVRLAQGQARTDDLSIDGPAAQIEIRGAADLQAQTFDQTVEVVPRTGNLLTVAGALAGGPVGAAIGAAANAMLNKPIGQLTARTYRVTGPWKDPKVEVTKKPQGGTSANQPRRAAPADAQQAPSDNG
ncbi:TIGR02099 family protein [Lysobacter sp. KIS68-7]|uniref:YhdP family protein n=1 Tax=Lysobacter sp. KIS68-7 TaxID=2904252 RepID=UPI001E2D33F1|nr:YhdP family protein [Lysobacter sp. KIS68-7]UHQ19451.1 TIGR02099 family protein [Lysobacter sp. KIS68-7]